MPPFASSVPRLDAPWQSAGGASGAESDANSDPGGSPEPPASESRAEPAASEPESDAEQAPDIGTANSASARRERRTCRSWE